MIMGNGKELLSGDEKVVINNIVAEHFVRHRRSFNTFGLDGKVAYIRKGLTTPEYAEATEWLEALINEIVVPMTKLLAQQTDQSWLILESLIDKRSDLADFPEWAERIRLIKKFKAEWKERPSAFRKTFRLCPICSRGAIVGDKDNKHCSSCGKEVKDEK